MRTMRTSSTLALCALILLPSAAQAQQDRPQEHVRGDVVALNGDTLDVRTRDNRVVHLRLAEKAGVAQVVDADPAALADGTFIGTTAVAEPDGTLRAIEVHLFPESMRGTGEGHRPWDRGPGSSMTNATVSGMSRGGGNAKQGAKSSMTNATVTSSEKAGGERTLTLKYQGGEQTVVVPPGIPIVKLLPGDRSLLVPGAHVFAVATAGEDGSLVAQRLAVGEGAVVPPM
ncbi:MAG TPA: hypothetical protein VFG53_17725 [Anaeromyxobacter sp.]|nr:hypothetical protein [Anaeromyxobacter sp.]